MTRSSLFLQNKVATGGSSSSPILGSPVSGLGHARPDTNTRRQGVSVRYDDKIGTVASIGENKPNTSRAQTVVLQKRDSFWSPRPSRRRLTLPRERNTQHIHAGPSLHAERSTATMWCGGTFDTQTESTLLHHTPPYRPVPPVGYAFGTPCSRRT